ncbi:MAG: adenylate/guanylate cyclase domain-containing protein [Candidatus Kapaibacterium sp.]
MKSSLLFLMIILTVNVYAEAPNKQKVDSLNALLKTSIPDSVRADTYFHLAKENWDDFPDKAMDYANQCLALSEHIGYTTGIADAYRAMSGVYLGKKDYLQSIKYKKLELQSAQKLHDSTRIANAFYALGNKYQAINDLNESLQYYTESLNLNERLGNKGDVAGLYHNIAMIYGAIGNEAEALQYYFKALKINEEVGNKEWKALNLQHIGGYYNAHGQLDKSLNYYEASLDITREIGNTRLTVFNMVGIGNNLSLKGDYTKAISITRAAAQLSWETKDTNGVTVAFAQLGVSYTQQKKFTLAALYLDSALLLDKLVGAGPDGLIIDYQRLYELDSARGNTVGALTNYKLYIAMRDSISNSESLTKAKQQKLRAEFAKKEAEAQAEQDKKDAEQATMRNGLITGLIVLFLLALILYNRFRLKKNANIVLEEKNQIISREKANVEREKERSDNLLLNILPAEVAEELKNKGTADAKQFDNVTVLFTDFISFTTMSEALTPQELVGELHTCFKAFDEICTKYSIEKIKTIGDAYLAVCGLPLADEKHAENVVKAALEIREFMANRSKELGAKTFEIRIGINSGSVVAGIVGVKKFAYDIWGDTVNTAARMEQNSEAGKINISETTYALVKDTFACEFRGEIDAKNKGKLAMYFVEKL